MTVFVLVPEAHTGGWVWEDVAGRLRESGAGAHPVTLTGMAGSRRPAGPGTDLETHVEDVLRVVDGAGSRDAADVVLVGHGYGIHPVLAAADRRPGRIARVVHLDAGLPRDGDPPLKLVPDQDLRARLSAETARGDDEWGIAPPTPGAWDRWGSTSGVPAGALARLAADAAPQPAGTLTAPLRLSGAAAALPTTGVLCTGNGTSIAAVEGLVGLGHPELQALTDPRVTFFELATGHWPMLSTPGELAGVLLKAAAGEGHRITATGEPPAHLRPFLLDVPERPRERFGRTDLYLPEPADGGGARPAVVFVHGGPVPAGARPTPRDWPAFAGYGRLAAARGAVGATVDHRLHELGDFPRAAEDLAEAVEVVRADPRVDADRVALWFFSAGGLLSADWLAAPPRWLRCVAATYPVLAPLPNWGLNASRFRPAAAAAVHGAGALPIVLTRVGRERTEIAATVEEFLSAAKDAGADVEVVDLPDGTHGFETTDHGGEARRAVERAMRTVLGHLRG
ncbi:dienelactone hydrolase family protein [Actinacidiphila sp. bgisy160]|uniref:dienelactone hydrolase family protein n=1 Tax=Actinacidiphila sp. bgisy160 TaxID=3413796 RepID=UPI003D72D50D